MNRQQLSEYSPSRLFWSAVRLTTLCYISECGEYLAALEFLECGASPHRFRIFWIAARPRAALSFLECDTTPCRSGSRHAPLSTNIGSCAILHCQTENVFNTLSAIYS